MLVKVSFKTCNNFPTFPNGTARPNGTEEFDKYRVWHHLPSFYLFLRIDDHPQCVTGVYDFPSALLFSVETMTTIGLFIKPMTCLNMSQVWFALHQHQLPDHRLLHPLAELLWRDRNRCRSDIFNLVHLFLLVKGWKLPGAMPRMHLVILALKTLREQFCIAHWLDNISASSSKSVISLK